MTTLNMFRGARYTIRELSEMSGVSTNAIYVRLSRGWTIEQAVCIPTREQIARGVVCNLPPPVGTGAGSVAREIADIDFSDSERSR